MREACTYGTVHVIVPSFLAFLYSENENHPRRVRKASSPSHNVRAVPFFLPPHAASNPSPLTRSHAASRAPPPASMLRRARASARAPYCHPHTRPNPSPSSPRSQMPVQIYFTPTSCGAATYIAAEIAGLIASGRVVATKVDIGGWAYPPRGVARHAPFHDHHAHSPHTPPLPTRAPLHRHEEGHGNGRGFLRRQPQGECARKFGARARPCPQTRA